MADKIYKPKKEEIKTQKTGTYFVAENKNGNSKKKSYSEYTKENLIAEIEKLKKRKKYGIVWEEQEEKFDKDTLGKLPVLKEIKNREIKTDKKAPVNLLIEGDNYHSLSVLNYTHEKAVDVIYIDPPYNTGNRDFIYNDSYVDREDSYRHSKWLSFIEKRLKLAKNLLTDAGLIFVSIDDNESAQLKLLMDDIFGENNFISCITVYSNPRGRQSTSSVALSHEYLFVYSKTHLGEVSGEPLSDERKKEYRLKDKHGFYREIGLRLRGGRATAEQSPTLHFPIYVDPKKAAISLEKKKGYIEIIPKFENGILGTWRWSKRKIVEDIDKLIARPVRTKNGDRWDIFEKDYLSEDKSLKVKSVWFDKEINYDNGADEIKKLFGKKTFNYSKPVALITKILKISADSHSIILDFFAGSGTTGQAVLELNKQDGGNRQFILCTNNENNNGNGLGVAVDICYPRIMKVVEGYKDAVNKRTIAGVGGNLKYFKTAFVDATPNDANKQKLTDQSTEMLCIRENTFEPVVEKAKLKIFRNDKKHTAIIFDQLLIPEFKKLAKNIEGPIHTYIFTLEDEDFSGEFDGLDGRIIVSPIPEAILRVYRRIFSIKL